MQRIAPARSIFAITFLSVAAAPAFATSSPAGIWLDDQGRGAVEIKSCGGAICGRVVWVKSAADAKSCGKEIIGGATNAGGGHWDNGWIYSPEKKQRYDVELTPLSDGRLKVVGYAGVKLFAKTMIWTRAPADLVRCGGRNEEAASTTATSTRNAEAPASGIALAKKADVTAAEPVAPTPPAAAPAATEPSATAEERHGQPKAGEAAPVEPKTNIAEGTEPRDTSATTGSAAQADGESYEDAPKASGGKLRLGDIDLDRVLKKNDDGTCKLDLPWVKVHFNCAR